MIFTGMEEYPVDILDLKGTQAGAAVAEWLEELAANGPNADPWDKMMAMAEYLKEDFGYISNKQEKLRIDEYNNWDYLNDEGGKNE